MMKEADAHPFVYWGQNQTHVFLSIRLGDAQDVQVDIADETFTFEAFGTGAHGRRVYKFSLDYYLPVVAKDSRYVITGRAILVKLRKELDESWPRLTIHSKRAPWIRLDFDLYHFDASDLDTEEEVDRAKYQSPAAPSDHVEVKVIRPSKAERDRHNAEMKELEDEEMWEAFVKIVRHPLTIYLLLFNLFQFAGFLCVFGTLTIHWLRPDYINVSDWYEFVMPRLVLVQLVQLFEPVHALLGWVRTSAVTSLMQAVGRSFVLFFIVLPHPSLQSGTTIFWLFFAWSAIEILRYPHYTLSLLGFKSGLLTYLRYTMWIPLYPLGFMCEGSLIIRALPLLSESRRFCIDMPNAFNMSLDFPMLAHMWLVGMLGAFYMLMRHMYRQRRRVIGPRPHVGADQMGFFSYIPMLRSLVSGQKKKALKHRQPTCSTRPGRTLPSTARTSLSKVK